MQLAKDTGNHGVANSGCSLLHVFDGQSRQQKAGVFNFYAVIQKYNPDWGPALGIIGMYQRIDDNLTQDPYGDAPNILSSDFGEIGAAKGMFF